MRRGILTLFLIAFLAFTAISQSVERITPTDVLEAKAHPQCSGGSLTADQRVMPENSAEDIKIASYMRQFRAYRDNGQHSPNMMIHINNDQIKSDARIRDVTPAYFQIEPTNCKNCSATYCFQYSQITEIVYDANKNLHIVVKVEK
jgi:hypothetical protein